MFLSAVCDSSRRVVEHYLLCSSLLFCDTSNNVVLVCTFHVSFFSKRRVSESRIVCAGMGKQINKNTQNNRKYPPQYKSDVSYK